MKRSASLLKSPALLSSDQRTVSRVGIPASGRPVLMGTGFGVAALLGAAVAGVAAFPRLDRASLAFAAPLRGNRAPLGGRLQRGQTRGGLCGSNRRCGTTSMQIPAYQSLERGTKYDNLRQRGAEGMSGHGYVSVVVVPTGVGAAIGGFAGDALPMLRTVASVCDTVITHPNVMNGASLYWPMDNVLYTEGFALDMFAAGEWGLLPVRTGGHRIGLLLDSGMDDDLVTRHLHAADAARATLGINVCGYVKTERPVNVTIAVAPSGASYGTIEDVESLLAAAHRLVDEAKCTAIAVVCRFPEDKSEEDVEMTKQYVSGGGMDPVGGAEAVISHLLTHELRIPVAHAPATDVSSTPDPNVSPKAAAEELGFTFLPCVLAYLHRAPVIIDSMEHPSASKAIWANDVDSIVVPSNSCGGMACLSLGDTETLVIAVEENMTLMNVTPDALKMDHVKAASYLEAIGLIAAHKLGVNPAALTSQITGVRDLGKATEGYIGNIRGTS